jgi:hypothetical protein
MKLVGLLIGLYICDNLMALDMVRRRKEGHSLTDRGGSANGRGRHFTPAAKQVT